MKILLLTLIFFLSSCSFQDKEKYSYPIEKIFYSSKNIFGFENIFGENLYTQDDLEILCERVLSSSVDGLIISNTTISRYSIDSSEAGGLSGQPIFDSSTSMLNKVYKYTDGKIPLIGVGGIDSAEKAYKKIKNGASLIQLYTGLVYKGPKLITEINKCLIKFIEKDGFNNISEAVGVEVN